MSIENCHIDELFCAEPGTEITATILFNLATMRITSAFDNRRHGLELQMSVAAGFELLGLGHTRVPTVWRDQGATTQRLERALWSNPRDPTASGALSDLWGLRRRLLVLPLSWRHVIEGNPLPFGQRGMRPGVRALCGRILDIASLSIEATRGLDALILEAYGARACTPVVTYQGLADSCPWAVGLNGGFYDWSDFGLTGEEIDKK